MFRELDTVLRLVFVVLALCAASVASAQERADAVGAVAPDVKQWITQLASPVQAERESATKALIAAGPRVMPEIYDALESKDAEVRIRAEFVAQALEAQAAKYLSLKLRVPPQVFPGVHSARFVERKLGVEEMQHLACLYRLETLVIQGSEINDNLFQYVGQVRNLKSLVLDSRDARGKATGSIDITDEALEHLRSLNRLTDFNVSGTRIRGKGFAALAELPSLQSIGIARCHALDESLIEGLEPFRGHKGLLSLTIAFCRVPKGVGEPISHIAYLQRLSLEGTTITDEELKPLSALPNLQRLYLGFTQISDAGVMYVTKCPQLQDLYLQDTQITNTGVRYLLKSPQLRDVDLSWTNVTPADLTVLSGLKTLRTVVVSGVCANEEQWLAVKKALPGVGVGWDPERPTAPRYPR